MRPTRVLMLIAWVIAVAAATWAPTPVVSVPAMSAAYLIPLLALVLVGLDRLRDRRRTTGREVRPGARYLAQAEAEPSARRQPELGTSRPELGSGD